DDMKLFDPPFYDRLQRELGHSMQSLLRDLCDQIDDEGNALALPTDFFRNVGARLPKESFTGYKVVGWIEELNDLTYFLDVQHRLSEQAPSEMAASLLAEMEEQFYENNYLAEIFPSGKPQATGLA